MGAKCIAITDRLRRKEATAQHFRDIFFEDGLHALFTLAPEDGIKFLCQFFAQQIALERVGGKQGCDDGTRVDFGGRLREILEKIVEPSAPDRIETYFLSYVHQDFIDQDERGQVLSSWQGEQINEQILRRSALTFGLITFLIPH